MENLKVASMSRAGFVYLDAGASRNKKGTGGREMDEYVGKICPHCKTEIKEGDEVKVCPECGIPHHAACWEVLNRKLYPSDDCKLYYPI